MFVENITNRRLIEQIAAETGLKVGGTLYSDALSEADGPAATYIDMMQPQHRHHQRRDPRQLRCWLDGEARDPCDPGSARAEHQLLLASVLRSKSLF